MGRLLLNRFILRVFICTIASFFAGVPLLAADATVPGEVSTPYPTIRNLAVEWKIEGDDNLNATATVRYRAAAAGEAAWRDAMPLRRVPAGQSETTNPIFSWGNKLSGSIFDLRP